MKNKKTCFVRTSVEVCCRYNYCLLKNTSIKRVLSHNEWIFDNAWNFWTYCRDTTKFQTSLSSVEPIIENTYILFSSMVHEFEDWEDEVVWDDYGAWYAYNFPTQKPKLKETLLLGNEWDLPLIAETNSPLTNYFSLVEEWQFIHNIRPDIFVVKKGKHVIVGSPDFYTTWLISRSLR